MCGCAVGWRGILGVVKLMELTAADEVRAVRLRRMKLVALSLLLLAAVVYVATLRLDHSGIWGYVNTGAEAAMVGALADWFAVTALFRHPLGLPIPHTALIPRKKDELAGSLQDFFADNFLTEEIARDRVHDAHIAARVGRWLTEDAHAQRVVTEGVRVSRALLGRVRDADVRSFADDVILPRLQREPMADIAGTLLESVVDDHAHAGFVDLVVGEVHDWLTANPKKFTAIVRDRAPGWMPEWVNQRVVSWTYWQALDWVTAIRDDREHPTRRALDDLLLRIARDLQHDPEIQARAEALKVRLLAHPQLGDTVLSLWRSVRLSLEGALDDPTSSLHTRAHGLVQRLAAHLESDAALQQRVDTAIADAASFVVNSYGDELSSVISHTIQRWDGEEASKRIELHVGRDLQFIRINGTVVGALAGLVIHAVSHLLS